MRDETRAYSLNKTMLCTFLSPTLLDQKVRRLIYTLAQPIIQLLRYIFSRQFFFKLKSVKTDHTLHERALAFRCARYVSKPVKAWVLMLLPEIRNHGEHCGTKLKENSMDVAWWPADSLT